MNDNHLTIRTVLILLILLVSMLLSAGCIGIGIEDVKKSALDAISPIVVLKGSEQYAKQYPEVTVTTILSTPVPTTATPVPEKTIAAKQVDMYANGERWQKQWFRHVTLLKTNQLSAAAPKKPLEFGIVIYDHKFMPSYTWWSDANGQYYREVPRPGNKFLFVWVHEEVFGDAKTHIPLMQGYNIESFAAQVGKNLYYNDTSYNPVNRILEFDAKPDYYRISRTSAFGYTRKYLGSNSKYGGWYAEQNYDLYIGQGNSWDGYIIYQVPVSANDSNTLLVGNFGANGNAFWRFDIYAGN